MKCSSRAWRTCGWRIVISPIIPQDSPILLPLLRQNRGSKISGGVTMLHDFPHVLHFKCVANFGEGQERGRSNAANSLSNRLKRTKWAMMFFKTQRARMRWNSLVTLGILGTLSFVSLTLAQDTIIKRPQWPDGDDSKCVVGED
jgi:hypothetical protein